MSIPSSVAVIGAYAFALCTSLEHVQIPASVIEINHAVFYGCDSLNTIIVEEESYAEEYCIYNQLPYQYYASIDWLNDD